jgi:potassium efflux system protein
MNKSFQRSIIGLLILLMLMGIPAISISLEEKEVSPDTRVPKMTSADISDLSLDELKAKRTVAEGADDLGDSDKKTVINLLDQAIGAREREAQLIKKADEIVQKARNTPQRIKEIEAALDQPPAELEPIEETALTMERSQLELRIQNIEADLAAARENLNNWLEFFKEQENRLKQRQPEIESARKKIAEIEEELLKAAPADDPPLIIEARRAALHAEKDKLEAEIKLYQQQLASQDALVSLSIAERDLAAREVALLESISKVYTEQAQRLRELEAKKELAEAELAKNIAVGLPPAVQNQFDINIELGKMLEKITAEESEIAEELERKQTRLKLLEEDFALAREQVKYPIHTETIGLALLELNRTLPSIQDYRRDSAQRRVLMGEIQSARLIFDRQRLELADLDRAIQNVLESVESLPQPEIENMKIELRKLLSDRRNLLKKLQERYRRVFANIQRLEFVEQTIVARAEQEALFLDEHLLWTRSAKRIRVNDLQNLPKALQWMLNPHNWWQVAQNLGLAFTRQPVLWVVGLLIAFTCMGLRRWAHRYMDRIARDVYSVKTDSFVLTLRALALTGRVLLGWPLLIGLVGWQLTNVSLGQDFPYAVGNGLVFAVQTLLGGLFIYEICWKNGLAKVHFKWPESVRRAMRRSLRWFILLAFAMTFIVAAAQTRNEAVFTDSLGRLCLMIFMAGFTTWAAYMLRFSGEIVTMLKRRRPRGWLVRLRFIWYSLSVGLPLVLALLAAMGYYYSAYALYIRMGETIALILVLIIAKDLVLRWLFIARRRLAFEEVRRKKEAEAEIQDKEQVPAAGFEGVAAVIEEPEINVDPCFSTDHSVFFGADRALVDLVTCVAGAQFPGECAAVELQQRGGRRNQNVSDYARQPDDFDHRGHHYRCGR